MNYFFSFNEAREQCQNKGAQWDLAVFESEEELDYVKARSKIMYSNKIIVLNNISIRK